MRILTVEPGPAFSTFDVYRGWTNALKTMATVATFNLSARLTFYETAGAWDADDERFEKMLETDEAIRLAADGLLSACYRFWPDVLLVVSGPFVPLDTIDVIRSRGTKVVIVHTEEPYEAERELFRAEHADLSLVNDPTYLHLFQEKGPAFYSPHCYDPTVHHPGPVRSPDDRSDFCFVGTGYASRIAFLEAVDFDGVDVALGGHWGSLADGSPLTKFVCNDLGTCIDNAEAAHLYRAAKMSANLYRKEADRPELSTGWAMGPREVELAAIGCPFLREPRGEGDEVLSMLPTFDGPDDFGDKLRWHLERPDVCADMARRARAAVFDRTFEASARGLLRTIDTL